MTLYRNTLVWLLRAISAAWVVSGGALIANTWTALPPTLWLGVFPGFLLPFAAAFVCAAFAETLALQLKRK